MSAPSNVAQQAHDSGFNAARGSACERKLAPPLDAKLENRLTIKDLERLRRSFLTDGDGYYSKMSLTKDQFCEALLFLLNKGTEEEYAELFDKIDVMNEGSVDWDSLASHLLLEFYEKDNRVKSTHVPQWKDLQILPSPHKDAVQRVSFLKNVNRYIAISKEGCISWWSTDLKPQWSQKTGTETCKVKDLWVTDFVPLQNVNKIALAFTSKEIAISDLSSKLEFNYQYKIQGLNFSPLCLDYWSNPNNANDAILIWGDVGGFINILFFNSANIALFERPPAPAGEKQEPCLNIQLKDIVSGRYRNASYVKYEAHNEKNKGEWVRKVQYSHYLECFISCATTNTTSVVIGWMEKHASASQRGEQPSKREIQRKNVFSVSQGVNHFDFNENLNLIVTAGVNNHVCLWNPYVMSKPNGILRGHMTSVVQVHFITTRNQLISFSKDKVVRIWDVQLQVCIQRLAGIFPKGPEVLSSLFFDDGMDRDGHEKNRMFITFNHQITVMDMKTEVKDIIISHEKPVVAAIYNSLYKQIVSVCQVGTIIMWLIDTGQKVKQFSKAHGNSEVTCLTQDQSETRLFTGSTDGTVKIWDFNGHCYHSLECSGGQPADVSQVLALKRTVVVVGWTKYITVFRDSAFREFHVKPSEWKGGQEHAEDILSCAFMGPNTLATGSYDGEVIIWNTNSEHASRHCAHKSRHSLKSRGRTGASFVKKNEFSWAVMRLIFLDNRKSSSTNGGANLVSCGGNGWVRFWNTSQSTLIAEYEAHKNVMPPTPATPTPSRLEPPTTIPKHHISQVCILPTSAYIPVRCDAGCLVPCAASHFLVDSLSLQQPVGSIIMASDWNNHFIVTADVEGFVKVWEVQEYAVSILDQPITNPPSLISHFRPHQDQINSLEICEKNERLLIISASSDCSISLWDISGNRIGTFGQEEHWKIEPILLSEVKNEEKHQRQEEGDTVASIIETDENSHWEPDDAAVSEPKNYRINTWDKTVLGKEYQKLRAQKRERKQPGLSCIHWEKTGALLAGPYSALETKELTPVQDIVKPDAEKYFNQELVTGGKSVYMNLPVLAETLTTVFDEKSVFPSYVLEFEKKMKNYHTMLLNQSQNKGNNELTGLQNLGIQTGKVGSTKSVLPGKSIFSAKGSLGLKSYPVSEIRKNSTSTITTFTVD